MFSELAERYNSQPWQKQLNTAVTRAIQDQIHFIFPHEHSHNARRDRRLLDYASGPGMISRALASRCAEAVAIDISPAMIDQYQAQMESYPVPGMKISAFVGNLFTEEGSKNFDERNFFDFDVAAIGFGFHHFENPGLCIGRLAERLKPGGVLLIVDFCEDGGHLPFKAGITAHGFSDASMKQLFEGEGLVDVGYHHVPGEFDMHMHGNEIKKSVFLARASKPTPS
ncbi:MAG: hypothetical protein Q9162_004993 [Coniocarpon cinnabarinum]